MKRMKPCLRILLFAALCCACVLALAACNGAESSVVDNSYDLSDARMGYRVTSSAPVYDGTPKTCSFMLTYDGIHIDKYIGGETHSDLNVTFSDNVNAGTAKAVVTPAEGSSRYRGTMTVEFVILPSIDAIEADGFDSLTAALAGGNHKQVCLSAAVEIPEGETLTVPEGIALSLNGCTFTNNGTVINDGTINFRHDGTETAEAYNNGRFVNNGTINMSSYSAFFNDGTFVNAAEGNVNGNASTSAFYSQTDVENSAGIEIYCRRHDLSEFDVRLAYDEIAYTGEKLRPSVTVSRDSVTASGSADYTVTYSDNVNAGTAVVTITANRYSRLMTGETSVTFAITRASITCRSATELFNAVNNPNYSHIEYAPTTSVSTNISDSFTVAEYAEVVINVREITTTGEVTVNGSLSVSGNRWNCKGNLNNNGTTKTDCTRTVLDCTVTNTADLTFGGCTENKGTVLNEGTLIAEDEFVNYGTLSDSGSASNLGTFFQDADATVTSVGGISNEGTVYANERLTAFVGGVFVVREEIGADSVSLETAEFVYDGDSKYPTLVFGKESVDRQTYDLTFRYDDATQDVSFPQDAGTVNAHITFLATSTTYFGEYTLTYEILPSDTTVTTESELKSALASGNYSDVTLGANIELTSNVLVDGQHTLTVPEGTDLVNGANITVEGKLLINGRYAEQKQGGMSFKGNGVCVNNGAAYFNDTIPIEVSGDGAVYVRTDIELMQIVNFQETVTYGTDTTPDVVLYSEDGLALSKDTDYTTTYGNCLNVTLNGVVAWAESLAATFSEHCYGSRRDEYSVVPAETEVDNFEAMYSALTNLAAHDVCNYSRIVLTADVSKTYDSYQTFCITVASNTTLVLGKYSMSLNATSTGRILVVNNGVIEISAANLLASSALYSGSGYVLGYADSADAFNHLAGCAHVIRLTANIEGACSIPSSQIDRTTVDLNGHSLSSLTLNTNIKEIEITGGVLKNTNPSKYGLYVTWLGNNTVVTLSDMTVYGISCADGYTVTIDPSCTVYDI